MLKFIFNMDWTKCALCQKDGGNLINPSLNKNPETFGYTLLAENGDVFRKEGLPLLKKWSVGIFDAVGYC